MERFSPPPPAPAGLLLRTSRLGRVGGAPAVALGVEFEDVGAVDTRSTAASVMASLPKILPQVLKGTLAITRTDRFSYRAPISSKSTLVLLLRHVGEIVEDQQVIFVELADGRVEGEVPAGVLKPLHQIRGAW